MISRQQTKMLKGIAVLMLMYHHLFLTAERTSMCFFLTGEIGRKLIMYSTLTGKLCVSIFLILSGYGISESCMHKSGGVCLKENLRRIYKLMKVYWGVMLVWLCIILLPLKIPFTDIYPSVFDFIIDLTGLSWLFRTSTLNGAWWYMTVIIMAYLLFPLIRVGVRRSCKSMIIGILALIAIFMIFFPIGGDAGSADFMIWLVPFTLGVIWSENKELLCRNLGIDEKIILQRGSDSNDTIQAGKRRNRSVLFGIVLLVMFVLLRQMLHTYNLDSLMTVLLLFILLQYCFWQKGIVGRILEVYGKHSYLIFLFHGFLIVYFRQYVYAAKLPIFVYGMFTAACLLIAVVVERIKMQMRRLFVRSQK